MFEAYSFKNDDLNEQVLFHAFRLFLNFKLNKFSNSILSETKVLMKKFYSFFSIRIIISYLTVPIIVGYPVHRLIFV